MRATPTHQAMQFVQIKSAKFPRFDQEFEDSTPDILTLTTLTSFLDLDSSSSSSTWRKLPTFGGGRLWILRLESSKDIVGKRRKMWG